MEPLGKTLIFLWRQVIDGSLYFLDAVHTRSLSPPAGFIRCPTRHQCHTRGLRITVFDILSWLGAGMSEAQILEEHPDLEIDDFPPCTSLRRELQRFH